MKKTIQSAPNFKSGLKIIYIIGLIFFSSHRSAAAPITHKFKSIVADTTIIFAIKTAESTGNLHYPLSVKRLYAKNGNKLVWVAPGKQKTHSWDAMPLLDCVVQYGLIPEDYHPEELTYAQLNLLTDHPEKVAANQKATFDILLTDAMITLINNLHFGKLNGNYPQGKLDAGDFSGCHADAELSGALYQKDFMGAIESLQPSSKAYTSLKYQMYLLTGLYTGDNYEIAESDIRKIAINMEHLRWANETESTYIAVNIPSFTMQFHQPAATYNFRIMAGKLITPTLPLESSIGAILISKGWNASSKRIYFTFYNRNGIYLGNIPDQLSFKMDNRALSNGTLSVEHAEKLARLLLINDGNNKSVPLIAKALKKNEIRSLPLKHPIPFRITYLTCAVNDGILVIYNDVYQLDQALEMRLYNVTNKLALDLSSQHK